jgi:hypothetical protein
MRYKLHIKQQEKNTTYNKGPTQVTLAAYRDEAITMIAQERTAIICKYNNLS